MESFSEQGLEGSILREPTGSRIFYFSAKSWAQIENELFNNFSTGASLFLIHLGQYYGKSVVKEVKLRSNEPKKAFETLEFMARAGGWGELSIRWRQGDDDIGFELKDCVFCSEDTKVSSCYFLQGIVAGAAAEVFGREYKVTETQCSRMGLDSCKFIVSPVETRPVQGLLSVLTRYD